MVLRRRVRQCEVVAEVRREPGGAGEDGQGEAGDDLAGAQRDHEECVDECHRRPRERRHGHRRGEGQVGGHVEPLHGPEPHHRTDEHHALDAEIENA